LTTCGKRLSPGKKTRGRGKKKGGIHQRGSTNVLLHYYGTKVFRKAQNHWDKRRGWFSLTGE